MIDPARITPLNNHLIRRDGQSVLYWMQSDQRPADNWALVHAIEQANQLGLPLIVAFFVWPTGRDPQVRHYDFMLRGLAETAQRLREQGIGFVMRNIEPVQGVVSLSREVDAAVVVADLSPLSLGRLRRRAAAEALKIPLVQVEARFVIPPEAISDKAFFAAYHARPKMKALYERFLTDYPEMKVRHRWDTVLSGLDDQAPDETIALLNLGSEATKLDVSSGPSAALERWHDFLAAGMHIYESGRNDPNVDATSNLSAYLHYGQISAQRVAYDLLNSSEAATNPEGVEAFLNELITWRELAENFTTFTPDYATAKAIPAWAQKSLASHAADPRDYIYERDELEQARTHDPLWNAAQLEMVKSGRMHGYMRMYWGKKILEWSESAEQAIATAVFLNDRYELDGRDANGYAGVLWAIGGLHDRPWFDRPVYGQVRYMNANGAKSKFDTDAYIARWS